MIKLEKYAWLGVLGVSLVNASCLTPPKPLETSRVESATVTTVSKNVDFSLDGLADADLALVKQYASDYDVDFRLVLAIIEQESRFDPDAISDRGAVGLMQLMPVTNAEIFDLLGLEGSGLPEQNLRAGTYYVSKLMTLFGGCDPEDQMKLVLAAYNAGPARIYDAQELAAYMGEDPHRWSTIATMLPLLSKRYYSLHESVWKGGRPHSGCFGGWRQTLTYVSRTMKSYRTLAENL